MKICTACKSDKSISEFHSQKEGRFGVRSVCKECRSNEWERNKSLHSAYKKKYYKRNKNKVKRKAQAWKNANREKHNEISRKWWNENHDIGLARQRAYRRANKESAAIAVKLWKRNNPEALLDYWHLRRAALRKVGGSHTRFQIAELLEKQSGFCAICQTNIRVKRHRDHRVPISAGGSNDISNIQLLCPSCNLGKRAKSMESYLKEIHGSI